MYLCTSESVCCLLNSLLDVFFAFLDVRLDSSHNKSALLIQKISSTLFAWGSYQFMHSISLMQLNCAVYFYTSTGATTINAWPRKPRKNLRRSSRGLFFLCIWRKGFKVQEPLDHMVSSWREKILPWFYRSLCVRSFIDWRKTKFAILILIF